MVKKFQHEDVEDKENFIGMIVDSSMKDAFEDNKKHRFIFGFQQK